MTLNDLLRGKGIDPEAWMNHYTSNGWRVGPNPMKDWRAAVRTWEKRRFVGSNGKPAIPDAIAAAKAKQAERDAAHRAAMAAEAQP